MVKNTRNQTVKAGKAKIGTKSVKTAGKVSVKQKAEDDKVDERNSKRAKSPKQRWLKV